MLTREHLILPDPKISPSELAPWLADSATLQEAHPYHRDKWALYPWVVGPARLRNHAEALFKGIEAAKYKDKAKMKELEAEHQASLLSVHLNATYIVMRWLDEKDDSIVHSTGYFFKEKTERSTPPSLRTTPQILTVRDLPNEPGSVLISFQRDPAAALYLLQYCKGELNGQEVWQEYGKHKGVRVTVTGLDRASWYNFKGASLGDNQTGPFSQPVSVIVT